MVTEPRTLGGSAPAGGGQYDEISLALACDAVDLLGGIAAANQGFGFLSDPNARHLFQCGLDAGANFILELAIVGLRRGWVGRTQMGEPRNHVQ